MTTLARMCAVKIALCRSEPTATRPSLLQYFELRMKSESLSLAALRASRLLSCVALMAALGVLSVRLYDAVELGNYLVLVMTPQSALCIATLALAALAVSVARPWAQRLGQLLAVLSCAFALP